MNIEAEIDRCHRQTREANRQILVARASLVLLVVPEFLGIKWAHDVAERQRDIIGERRYAREEFLMNAGRYEAMLDPDHDPDDWQGAFD